MENFQNSISATTKVPAPLALLRDLDNVDKHKLVRIAFATPMEGDIGFSGPANPLVKKVEAVANYGEIKDGAELVSHAFDVSTPNMEYDRIDIEMSVAIWHKKKVASGPDWSARTDVPALLTLITGEVKHVIDVVGSAVQGNRVVKLIFEGIQIRAQMTDGCNRR